MNKGRVWSKSMQVTGAGEGGDDDCQVRQSSQARAKHRGLWPVFLSNGETEERLGRVYRPLLGKAGSGVDRQMLGDGQRGKGEQSTNASLRNKSGSSKWLPGLQGPGRGFHRSPAGACSPP